MPLGERGRAGRPVNVEVRQPELGDEGSRRDRREPVGLLADGAVIRYEQALMEQLCGLLLERHASEELVDPVLDRETWVLVRVELAVSVQVSERGSVGVHAPAGSRLLALGVEQARHLQAPSSA